MAARLTAMRFFLYLGITLLALQAAAVGTVIVATQQLPAGQIIAYVSFGELSQDIFILDVNTGIARNLTSRMGSSDESEPAWSPDGSQIVFSSWNQENWQTDIYVIDIYGDNLRQLTSPNLDNEIQPAWSPDGQQIAFDSDRDNNHEIFVMDANGNHTRQLTDTPLHENSPVWSPDGKFIAYSLIQEDGSYSIYIMDANGSNQRQLVANDAVSTKWSPDGAHIAFMSARYPRIFVMEVATGHLQAFDVTGYIYRITWLPDSRHIAFESDPCNCAPEVYVMNISTGDQYRFPFGAYAGHVPVWRPG
jgi:TolB protein